MPADPLCYAVCVGVCTGITEGIGLLICAAGCAVACDPDTYQSRLRFKLSRDASIPA